MTESEAWKIIKKYPEVKHHKGVFTLPKDFVEPKDLKEALDYLWIEWDYQVIQ